MARLRWLVTLALAACAATPQATPGTPSVGEPVPTQVSAAPSVTAPSPMPEPLGSVLPEELGGIELHTFAVGQDTLERLAAQLRVDTKQLDVRFASEHGARFLQMYALRVPGMSGPQLVEAWVAAAYPPDIADVDASEHSIAGKTVTVVHAPSAAARLGAYYVYSSGDTLLVIQAIDPAVAAEALNALP